MIARTSVYFCMHPSDHSEPSNESSAADETLTFWNIHRAGNGRSLVAAGARRPTRRVRFDIVEAVFSPEALQGQSHVALALAPHKHTERGRVRHACECGEDGQGGQEKAYDGG